MCVCVYVCVCVYLFICQYIYVDIGHEFLYTSQSETYLIIDL